MFWDNCPACNENAWLHVGQRTELNYANVQHEAIYGECDRCGLVKRLPQPSDEELHAYYSRAWMTQTNRLPEALESAARWIAEGIAPYTMNITSALDVGARDTAFLAVVNERLPIASMHAEDPNPRSKEAPKGWVSSAGHDEPAERHQLVTTTHVMEHVRSPREFLDNLSRRVRADNGFIYIEVPALEDCHYSHNIHRDHLWHYSIGSLVRLCSQGKWNIIRTGTERSPKGWPTNRILLGTQVSSTGHFEVQLDHEDQRAYQAALRILAIPPRDAVLYAASSTLVRIVSLCNPEKREQLKKYTLVDAYKTGSFLGWQIQNPEMGLVASRAALITTAEHQSTQDIRRYIKERHPGIVPISLFFD